MNGEERKEKLIKGVSEKQFAWKIKNNPTRLRPPPLN
jgi:hypothetical protein